MSGEAIAARCSADGACLVALDRVIEPATRAGSANTTLNDARAISQSNSNAQEAQEAVYRRHRRVFGCSSPAIYDGDGTGSGFELLVLDGAPTYSSLHVHDVQMHVEVETDAGLVAELPRVHAVAKDVRLGVMAAMEVGYRDGGSLRQ